MTEFVRPSDGRRRAGHICQNVKGFRPGERVLYEGFSGPRIASIDRYAGNDGNSFVIGVEVVQVTRIKGRVPAGLDEAKLLDSLTQAEREHGRAVAYAHQTLEETRARLLKAAGIR